MATLNPWAVADVDDTETHTGRVPDQCVTFAISPSAGARMGRRARYCRDGHEIWVRFPGTPGRWRGLNNICSDGPVPAGPQGLGLAWQGPATSPSALCPRLANIAHVPQYLSLPCLVLSQAVSLPEYAALSAKWMSLYPLQLPAASDMSALSGSPAGTLRHLHSQTMTQSASHPSASYIQTEA